MYTSWSGVWNYEDAEKPWSEQTLTREEYSHTKKRISNGIANQLELLHFLRGGHVNKNVVAFFLLF